MSKLFFFKDLDSRYIMKIFGIRFILKHKSNVTIPNVKEYGLTDKNRKPKLIVSLTSYPARINSVHKTIRTILTQSLKPDKVILWLEKSEFQGGEKDLPAELLMLKEYGLSIEWTDFGLRSYKKLIPALLKYPDDIIVTTDDDVLYSPKMIESLYNEYLKDTSNIYVKRAVRLGLKNNEIYNISSRKYDYHDLGYPSYFNQQMGAAACLYPPHALHSDCTNIEKLKKLLPTHDDVYFKVMATLNRVKVKVVGGFNEDLNIIEETQNVGLININKTGAQGVSLNEAYKIMQQEYPEIIQILKEGLND